MTRLYETYKNEIVDAMTKKFGYKNVMQVPKLAKIVVIWVSVKQKRTLRFSMPLLLS